MVNDSWLVEDLTHVTTQARIADAHLEVAPGG